MGEGVNGGGVLMKRRPKGKGAGWITAAEEARADEAREEREQIDREVKAAIGAAMKDAVDAATDRIQQALRNAEALLQNARAEYSSKSWSSKVGSMIDQYFKKERK